MKSILLIAAFVLLFCQQQKPVDDYVKTTLVEVGDKAPNFECQTISGDNFVLNEQKGKVVLVSYFATW